jgi:hypothetical protein
MTILDWIAFAVCVTSNIAVIQHIPLAFLAWTMGNCILIYLAVRDKNWARMGLFVVYSIINLYGLWEWTR